MGCRGRSGNISEKVNQTLRMGHFQLSQPHLFSQPHGSMYTYLSLPAPGFSEALGCQNCWAFMQVQPGIAEDLVSTAPHWNGRRWKLCFPFHTRDRNFPQDQAAVLHGGGQLDKPYWFSLSILPFLLPRINYPNKPEHKLLFQIRLLWNPD